MFTIPSHGWFMSLFEPHVLNGLELRLLSSYDLWDEIQGFFPQYVWIPIMGGATINYIKFEQLG